MNGEFIILSLFSTPFGVYKTEKKIATVVQDWSFGAMFCRVHRSTELLILKKDSALFWFIPPSSNFQTIWKTFNFKNAVYCLKNGILK